MSDKPTSAGHLLMESGGELEAFDTNYAQELATDLVQKTVVANLDDNLALMPSLLASMDIIMSAARGLVPESEVGNINNILKAGACSKTRIEITVSCTPPGNLH